MLSMKSLHYLALFLFLLAIPSCRQEPKEPDATQLARQFEQPPMEYRPYVWWHWMGPNFSKEGIRKDLEAMKEAGIGGATIFNIASAVQETHHPMENNPWPEQTYRSEAYWEALAYAAQVAQELGLKIGLHNSPGYSTTGGPWIDEEKGMQTVVSRCTEIGGGRKVEMMLPQPELPVYGGWGNSGRQATFYKDIAVMAVPVKADARPEEVLDLSSLMDAEGKLVWEAPAGRWKVYRIGHAPTLSNPHPLPDDLIGKALEADKINAQVSAYHWDQVLNPLEEHLGQYFGKSFTHILIDSYEAGDQNWTPGFRDYFQQVCGYDPLPRIALMEADPENSRNAAFQEDWKVLIERRFLQEGWQVARDKVHEKGLLLFWEPYWGPFSITESVFVPDVPMGEFWTGGNGYISAAIVDKAKEYGKNIVGAEAFTGRPEVSHFTEDPEFLKHSADGAFVSGVNRLFLHHWVHQPFDDRYQPGMGMGWWGTHFSRHQTWFEPGKAFFTYLSRCQMLLQQGEAGERGDHWIQRITPWGQLYFVTNPGDKRMAVSFPKGRQPAELWDPYRGTIELAFEADSVRVILEPGQSVFVIQPDERTRYAKRPMELLTMVQRRVLDTRWDVQFAPKLEDAFELRDFELKDFSASEDPRLKYFAGTATYKGHFTHEPTKGRLVLELGKLNDIAELSVNGKKVGVLWYPPFKADITDYVRPGDNTLEIAVTNNWANRLIGDEQYEADFEWGEDRGEAMGRAMKSFPEWFLKGEPRPSKDRKAFVIWSYFRKDSPLQPAGLVGPVTLSVCGPEALPDPLVKADGKRVKTASEWMEIRRPQILELFAQEMYGHVPERPEGLHFQTISEEKVYGGLGIRKTVRIYLDAEETHSFDVLLHLPAGAEAPVPVFAGLNFNSNEATLDTREGHRWPYEDILRAGFGVATAWRDSIEPDKVNGEGGVRSWYNPGGDWGAISAWAWGLSRILDYLETEPAVDPARVAVIGHSRLGKTALWAGANDPRFAAVISNDSGCCGAAISRRRIGETFAAIDRSFPHWFTREFDKYKGAEDQFPADQHWLCALAAPRPLYVASATEDTWADPEGEWLSARAVAPVYALFGETGIGPSFPSADMPDNKGTVAYHVRTGTHGITRWDWLQYMDWFKNFVSLSI